MEGVQTEPSNGGTQYAVSQSGTPVYLPGGLSEQRSRIVMASRSVSEEKQFDVKLSVEGMALSPDGRRLALQASKANDDLHILELDGGMAPRFTLRVATSSLPFGRQTDRAWPALPYGARPLPSGGRRPMAASVSGYSVIQPEPHDLLYTSTLCR